MSSKSKSKTKSSYQKAKTRTLNLVKSELGISRSFMNVWFLPGEAAHPSNAAIAGVEGSGYGFMVYPLCGLGSDPRYKTYISKVFEEVRIKKVKISIYHLNPAPTDTAEANKYKNNNLLLFGAWDRTGNSYQAAGDGVHTNTIKAAANKILDRVTAIPSCKVVVSTYTAPGKLVSQISAVQGNELNWINTQGDFPGSTQGKMANYGQFFNPVYYLSVPRDKDVAAEADKGAAFAVNIEYEIEARGGRAGNV